MSLVNGSAKNITFAAANIVGASNEDRASATFHHHYIYHGTQTSIDGLDFHSFSLFDGHNGGFASQQCASKLHQMIADDYYKLIKYHESTSQVSWDLTTQQIYESLFCEAVHRGVRKIDKDIRSQGDSGTTWVSIFLFPVYDVAAYASHHASKASPSPLYSSSCIGSKGGGGGGGGGETGDKGSIYPHYRAIFANIGDSRCVMMTAEAVSSHKERSVNNNNNDNKDNNNNNSNNSSTATNGGSSYLVQSLPPSRSQSNEVVQPGVQPSAGSMQLPQRTISSHQSSSPGGGGGTGAAVAVTSPPPRKILSWATIFGSLAAVGIGGGGGGNRQPQAASATAPVASSPTIAASFQPPVAFQSSPSSSSSSSSTLAAMRRATIDVTMATATTTASSSPPPSSQGHRQVQGPRLRSQSSAAAEEEDDERDQLDKDKESSSRPPSLSAHSSPTVASSTIGSIGGIGGGSGSKRVIPMTQSQSQSSSSPSSSQALTNLATGGGGGNSSPSKQQPQAKVHVHTVAVTEDHHLQLARERYRIGEKIRMRPQTLPYDLSLQQGGRGSYGMAGQQQGWFLQEMIEREQRQQGQQGGRGSGSGIGATASPGGHALTLPRDYQMSREVNPHGPYLGGFNKAALGTAAAPPSPAPIAIVDELDVVHHNQQLPQLSAVPPSLVAPPSTATSSSPRSRSRSSSHHGNSANAMVVSLDQALAQAELDSQRTYLDLAYTSSSTTSSSSGGDSQTASYNNSHSNLIPSRQHSNSNSSPDSSSQTLLRGEQPDHTHNNKATVLISALTAAAAAAGPPPMTTTATVHATAAIPSKQLILDASQRLLSLANYYTTHSAPPPPTASYEEDKGAINSSNYSSFSNHNSFSNHSQHNNSSQKKALGGIGGATTGSQIDLPSLMMTQQQLTEEVTAPSRLQTYLDSLQTAASFIDTLHHSQLQQLQQQGSKQRKDGQGSSKKHREREKDRERSQSKDKEKDGNSNTSSSSKKNRSKSSDNNTTTTPSTPTSATPATSTSISTAACIQMSREESYFAIRYDSTGTIQGPLAYYGRFLRSILMTRSIGDRFGPRGCIPLAELTSCWIPRRHHARFILASDGLWDVVDTSDIHRLSLSYRHAMASTLATYLCYKAKRRRERYHMRRDDISVLVLDVYPMDGLFLRANISSNTLAGLGPTVTVTNHSMTGGKPLSVVTAQSLQQQMIQQQGQGQRQGNKAVATLTSSKSKERLVLPSPSSASAADSSLQQQQHPRSRSTGTSNDDLERTIHDKPRSSLAAVIAQTQAQQAQQAQQTSSSSFTSSISEEAIRGVGDRVVAGEVSISSQSPTPSLDPVGGQGQQQLDQQQDLLVPVTSSKRRTSSFSSSGGSRRSSKTSPSPQTLPSTASAIASAIIQQQQQQQQVETAETETAYVPGRYSNTVYTGSQSGGYYAYPVLSGEQEQEEDDLIASCSVQCQPLPKEAYAGCAIA